MIDNDRTLNAIHLASLSSMDAIVTSATFDGNWESTINFIKDVAFKADLRSVLKTVQERKLVIVDLCSGTGAYGLALGYVLGAPCHIHFVDIVGEYHEIAKSAAKSILPDKSVVECHTCSADDTPIASGSVDIVIEVDGFHHCPSLPSVMKEAHRILRYSGTLLAVDRVHENRVSRSKLDALLDFQYPQEWLTQRCYASTKLTRRENGESELKLDDWMLAFSANRWMNITRTTYVKRGFNSFKYYIISQFPDRLLPSRKWPLPTPWPFPLLLTILFGITLRNRPSAVLTNVYSLVPPGLFSFKIRSVFSAVKI